MNKTKYNEENIIGLNKMQVSLMKVATAQSKYLLNLLLHCKRSQLKQVNNQGHLYDVILALYNTDSRKFRK